MQQSLKDRQRKRHIANDKIFFLTSHEKRCKLEINRWHPERAGKYKNCQSGILYPPKIFFEM